MTPYTKQIVELHKIHKAIENCGCNKDDEQGGGNIPSDDIGYEEIYQFYAKQLKSFIPAEAINEYVIPDTFNDIINVENNVYPNDTFGIWKANIDNIGNPAGILFATISQNGAEDFIFIGQSINSDGPII